MYHTSFVRPCQQTNALTCVRESLGLLKFKHKNLPTLFRDGDSSKIKHTWCPIVRYRQAESADVKELTKMKASCQQQSALCFVVTEPRHSEASDVQISCFGPTLSYIDKTAIPLSPIGSPAFYEIFSELLHRADGLQEECHKHRFESFDQSFAAMMEGRSNGCEYMLCEISRSCRRHRLRVPASGTKSGLWIQAGGSGQIQQGRASRQSTI
ncbi:hypothetical protein EDD85DRAFT_554907 [Armillaria nabsnona]|nr:hypothetical protein EDD85DRAFT_554907 [Armillaria nabsnona]